MTTRLREYARPADPEAARELLSRPGAAPLMLGPRPAPLPEWDAQAAVDLSRLELNYVHEDAGGAIRIGALTPLEALAQSALLQGLADGLLARAARCGPHPGLRRVASVGGLLAGGGAGAPEAWLALLALEATVHTTRAAVPLAVWEEEGRGKEEGEKAAGELLLEISFPRPAEGARAAIARVARSPRDEAIVAAVALLEMREGACHNVRLALSGAHPRPTRLPAAEALLEGQALTPDRLDALAEAVSAAARPVGDFRGGAEYRRAMAGVVVRRAVARAMR